MYCPLRSITLLCINQIRNQIDTKKQFAEVKCLQHQFPLLTFRYLDKLRLPTDSDEDFMDARTIFIVILLYHFSQSPANYCKGAGSATHIRD